MVMSNSLSSNDSSSSRRKRGGVVYIDTELKFDSMRLIDVAISRFPEIYSTEYAVDAPHQIDTFLSSVKVSHLNYEGCLDCISVPVSWLFSMNTDVHLFTLRTAFFIFESSFIY